MISNDQNIIKKFLCQTLAISHQLKKNLIFVSGLFISLPKRLKYFNIFKIADS